MDQVGFISGEGVATYHFHKSLPLARGNLDPVFEVFIPLKLQLKVMLLKANFVIPQ